MKNQYSRRNFIRNMLGYAAVISSGLFTGNIAVNGSPDTLNKKDAPEVLIAENNKILGDNPYLQIPYFDLVHTNYIPNGEANRIQQGKIYFYVSQARKASADPRFSIDQLIFTPSYSFSINENKISIKEIEINKEKLKGYFKEDNEIKPRRNDEVQYTPEIAFQKANFVKKEIIYAHIEEGILKKEKLTELPTDRLDFEFKWDKKILEDIATGNGELMLRGYFEGRIPQSYFFDIQQLESRDMESLLNFQTGEKDFAKKVSDYRNAIRKEINVYATIHSELKDEGKKVLENMLDPKQIYENIKVLTIPLEDILKLDNTLNEHIKPDPKNKALYKIMQPKYVREKVNEILQKHKDEIKKNDKINSNAKFIFKGVPIEGSFNWEKDRQRNTEDELNWKGDSEKIEYIAKNVEVYTVDDSFTEISSRITNLSQILGKPVEFFVDVPILFCKNKEVGVYQDNWKEKKYLYRDIGTTLRIYKEGSNEGYDVKDLEYEFDNKNNPRDIVQLEMIIKEVNGERPKKEIKTARADGPPRGPGGIFGKREGQGPEISWEETVGRESSSYEGLGNRMNPRLVPDGNNFKFMGNSRIYIKRICFPGYNAWTGGLQPSFNKPAGIKFDIYTKTKERLDD